MFDIGFAELILIAVVGLLVIGPERLPSAIRTGSLWLNRIKRGFSDIKREVEQELHNDAVLQELRKTGKDLQTEANDIGSELREATESLNQPVMKSVAAADNTTAKEPRDDAG
jgi:sec-independent protein translocase protein TatB